MLLRLISTLTLALVALVILAWPLSLVGLHYQETRAGVQLRAGIADGALYLISDTSRPPKFLECDRFAITTGGRRGVLSLDLVRLWPRVQRTGKTLQINVPLLLTLLIVALPAALLVGVPLARLRRCRLRSLCPSCAYPASQDAHTCPECGLSRSAAHARATSRFRGLVRDTFVATYLVMIIACLAGWAVFKADERSAREFRSQAFDYSWFLGACTPRLTGKVAFAAPGSGPDGIENVLRNAGAGTTIVLLPGHHTLGRYGANPGTNIHGVWLLGADRSTTTISLHLQACTRLRVEGLTIECADDEFLYLRDSGSAHVRDCLIQGYNSGAGGSYALRANDSALLFESCEFEGKSGHSSTSTSHRGNALDSSGDTRLYLRDVRFTNNSEAFRNGNGTLDHCTITSDQTSYPPSGGDLWQRDCLFPALPFRLGARTFTQAFDDLSVLQAADHGRPATPSMWSDPLARQAAAALRLDRSSDFWFRLLAHSNPEVRRVAATHLTLKALPSPKLTPEEALAALDRNPLQPTAALVLLDNPDAVRSRLEHLLAEGNPNLIEAGNAAAILRLMKAQPPLPDLVRQELQRQQSK